MLSNFLVRSLQYLKKLKKAPSKVTKKYQNRFLPAQMAQSEELVFQNVAYRPTVYKT